MTEKPKKIPDQSIVWDKKHSADEHELLRNLPSPFAQIAEQCFPRNGNILELGCGVGRDAMYFENSGHLVTATDSSEVVIRKNKQHLMNSKVNFKVLDMQEVFPFENEVFDVVYANLSLHYYLDIKTREIIRSINSVLKVGGMVAFSCKSHDEYRTKEARVVEPNVFVDKNNHAIHLFSLEYTKELVAQFFDIISIDEIDEEYMGRVSGIIRCIARKRE